MTFGVRGSWTIALAGLVMAGFVVASAFPLSASAQALTAARFSLVIDGAEVGSFAEATISTDVQSVDTTPTALKKLPGKRTPPTLTLKRGKSSTSLLRWASLPIGGAVESRKSGSLVMYNTDGAPVARYHLENAWPTKIEVVSLDASKNEVSIETLELVADSVQLIP